MEVEKNIISSEAKLSAIAGVMFFAPFVKSRINSNLSLTDVEKSFVSGYIKIGWVNLIFLVIVLITAGVNIFLMNGILSWIVTIGSIIIFIISAFSSVACINDLPVWGENESIKQNIPHKLQILKSYTPIVDFILWFRQENYNMPYWWLKESVLLWTSFIFGTLLFGNSFGIWILIAIAIRVLLLLINVDIIPLSIKKALNGLFSCNPGEMMAYIFAPLMSKFKKIGYETVLNDRKLGYAQGQSLGIGIIVQYVLFIGIMYLIYRNIVFSLNQIVLLIAAILRFIRVLLFYIYKKKFLRIPILSEIVSLIFH